MKIFGRVLFYAALVVSVGGMPYLYQHQLGSVSFFLLAIVFFVLGFKLVRKRK